MVEAQLEAEKKSKDEEEAKKKNQKKPADEENAQLSDKDRYFFEGFTSYN